MIIAWFSGGVTSAVATKLAIQKYNEVDIYFCETGQHHQDAKRFKKDCERWFGQKIHTLQNPKWINVENVLNSGYINSPHGAYCTKVLKKDMRLGLEKITVFEGQVFGFEYEPKQIKRAERFLEQYPTSKGIFPLIEQQINKKQAMQILANAGIRLPKMYELGYSNANCIGCVKGGKGYWNKIRKDFPEIFKKTAELERKAGHSCINGVFLDELDPKAGRHENIALPECGIYCEIEMMGND